MSELSLPLSNVQLELLKLYAAGVSEEEMKELKLLLANFYAAKSIQSANEVWDEKNLTKEDMDSWLNSAS